MQMEFFGGQMLSFYSMDVFYAVIVGLIVGGVISYMTEHFTGLGKKPVLDIVQKSSTGAATNIIAGLATGMISTFGPILLFAGAIYRRICFRWILWCCHCSICDDGDDCDATGH